MWLFSTTVHQVWQQTASPPISAVIVKQLSCWMWPAVQDWWPNRWTIWGGQTPVLMRFQPKETWIKRSSCILRSWRYNDKSSDKTKNIFYKIWLLCWCLVCFTSEDKVFPVDSLEISYNSLLAYLTLDQNLYFRHFLSWCYDVEQHRPDHHQLLVSTFNWFDQYDGLTTKCVSVVQMKRHGFGHFVGIDGSETMLELARQSGLYQDLKQSMLGEEPLPVQWGNFMVHYFTWVIDHCDSVGDPQVEWFIRYFCCDWLPSFVVIMIIICLLCHCLLVPIYYMFML